MAHLYDNLLCPDSALLFDGVVYNASEEMSPSTERLAVFLWLHYIDERLPMYVARVYAHDLQRTSLKDLQPIISQNMHSLLAELATQEDIKLAYSHSSSSSSFGSKHKPFRSQNKGFPRRSGQGSKSCAFCKACNKPYLGHDVKNCWSLSRFNKSDIVSSLMVEVDDDPDEISDDFSSLSTGNRLTSVSLESSPQASVSRVEVMKSPSFVCSYKKYPCKVYVDTGATSNIISLPTVKACGMRLLTTNQGARQLDGSQVKICGEVDEVLNFGSERLRR